MSMNISGFGAGNNYPYKTINTNSKQYKAVIQQMTKDGSTGNMYTNVQAIKNLMKQYDSDGNLLNAYGVA